MPAFWLNAVEGFLAKLTKQRLKRGVFHSLVSLQSAIKRYLAEANTKPKPFRWTKDPDDIITTVRRGYQALDFEPLGLPPTPQQHEVLQGLGVPLPKRGKRRGASPSGFFAKRWLMGSIVGRPGEAGRIPTRQRYEIGITLGMNI